MSTFDINKYLQTRLASNAKIDDLIAARQRKVEALSINRDGFGRTPEDIARDVAVTAVKGAVGLPQAVVGVADIFTGGQVGKGLEELGFRPNEAQEQLSGMYSEQQKIANQKVQSADGFMGTLSAAIDNPSVIATSIGESLPQMFGGALVARGLVAAGMGAVKAGAIGEGVLGAGSAASQIRGETEDGLLTGKQSLAALGSGVGTAILGFAGGKLAQKAGVPDIDTMLASGSRVSPAGFFKAVVGAGISEGAFEEMPQSAQEQMWQNFALDKPVMEGVQEAAAMGLITGAVMGGMGGAATLGAGGKKKPAKDNSDLPPALKEAQLAAIESGDVSGLVDPKSPNFAPDLAIAALAGNAEKTELTNDQRATNLKKGQELYDSLEASRDMVAMDLETKDQRQAKLKSLEQQLSSTDPKNTKKIAFLEDEVAMVKEDLAKPELTKAQRAKYELELQQLDTRLGEASKNLKSLSTVVQTPAFVAEQVETIKKPLEPTGDAEVDSQAVAQKEAATQRILSMAMTSPELLDPVVAADLANDKANSLTETQRTFLRKFSDARVAANALRNSDDVSKEVLEGSDENKGILTYRKEITKAVARNDQRGAERSLRGMVTFSDGHTNKAQVATQAKKDFDKDGKNRRLVSTQDGWVAEMGYWADDKERRKNGGLNIGSNADALVKNVFNEAKALRAATNEMRAAYQLSFNKPTAGVANVTQPEQPQGVGAQQEAAPTTAAPATNQQAEAAGSVDGRGSDGATAVKSPAVEQTTRVKKPRPKKTVLTEIQKAIRDANKAYKKVARSKTGSLWSVLKHTLTESELADIYGTEWKKKYTMMKGKPGRSLSSAVRDGALDEFLPFNMRTGTEGNSDLELEAVEFIKQQLRDGAYLTYETAMLLQQIEESIQSLEEANFQDIQDEIDRANQEIDNEQGRQAEETSDTATEESAGSVEAPVGNQEAEGDAESEVEDDFLPPLEPDAPSRTESSDSTELTEGSTDPLTNTEETSLEENQSTEEGTTAEAAEPGGLTQLRQENPEGSSYLSKNLITAGFKQKKSASMPLVKVQNFLSVLAEDISKAAAFVQESLSDPQKASLKFFVDKVSSWMAQVGNNLPQAKTGTRAQFKIEDMMQFLLNEDGDADENVKTAIAYAAFQGLADVARGTRFNDKKAINGMLGRDDKRRVSDAAYEMLSNVGKYQHVLHESLGGVVMTVLGLSVDTKTPADQAARLKTALGAHALKLLEDKGLVVRTSYLSTEVHALREEGLESAEDIAKLRKKYPLPDEQAVTHFFAVARDEAGNLLPEIEELVEAAKKSEGVLEKLFKTDPMMVAPSLEPITNIPVNIPGTDRKIPDFLRKVLEKKNKEPNHLRQVTWGVAEMLGEDLFMEISGVQEVSDDLVHIVNRRGVKAKNDGLWREYLNLKEFVEGTLANSENGFDTPFYFPFVAWINQRVGNGSNMVNAQASKIVRFLVGSNTWNAKLDSTNPEHMESFYMRVGEGLGTKTEQKINADNLIKIKDAIADPVIQAGVDALRKSAIRGEELTDAEKESIVDAVKKGGVNVHTLDALIGLAQQQEAESKVEPNAAYTFDVQMMSEVDGVANGTMLNHMLYGAAHNVKDLAEFMKKGGFYLKGGDYEHYSAWRGEKDNLDVYENTARDIYENMEMFLFGKPPITRNMVNAIWTISGKIFENNVVTKDGRNLVKGAMNPLNYGSSMSKAVASMTDAFLDSLYGKFEKMARNGYTEEALRNHVAAINTLLPDGMKLPEGESMQFYMDTPLGTAREAKIKKAFKDTVGKVSEDVIESNFASLLENGKQLVKASNLAYDLYAAVRDGVRDQYIEELIQAGELETKEVKGEKRRLTALNKEQEQELNKRLLNILPTVKTGMSKLERGYGSDISMVKTESGVSLDPVYTNDTSFGTNVVGNDLVKGKSFKLRAQNKQETGPGVRNIVFMTHSLDSYIAHKVQATMDVLNIHDALGAGVLGLKDVAQLLNKATYEALLEYSPLEEIYQSLSGVVKEIARNTEEFGMYPGVAAKLDNLLKGFAEKGPDIFEYMEHLKRNAAAADRVKLEFMAQLGFVDQYAFEGGQHVVTDFDRKAAANKLAAVTDQVDSDTISAWMTLQAFASEKVDAPVFTPADTRNSEAEGVDPDMQDNSEEAVGDADADTRVQEKPTVTVSKEHVANILNSISQDTALPESLRDQAIAVIEALKNGAKSVTAAIEEVVKPLEVDSFIGLIKNRMQAADRNHWGTLGTPLIAPDQALVAFFASKPNPKAKDVLFELSKQLNAAIKTGNATESQKLQLAIVEQLYKTVDPEMSIHYITRNTSPDLLSAKEIAENGLTNSRGWFHPNGSGVYLKSPEFVNSGLTVELVLHEMVHASVSAKLTSTDRSVKPLVEELMDLHQAAIQAFGNEFKTELSSLDEFVAWGMTNPKLQSKLKELKFTSKRKENSLVTGWKAFVDTINKLLFGDNVSKRGATNNGLSVLFQNVAGVMNAVSKEKEKQTDGKKVILSMASVVKNYSAVDIHRALNDGRVTPAFQQHLEVLLGNITEKLSGPFNAFKASLQAEQANTPQDVWLKALTTGKAPFASEAMKIGMAKSEQEGFAIEQIELIVKSALETNENQTKVAYRELYKLYTEARGKMTQESFHDGDWATATADEKAQAQKNFDLVFGVAQNNGQRSDYMARFVALGLGHEGFNKLMQFGTTTRERTGGSLTSRIQNWFADLLALIQNKLTGTYAGQRADFKMEALVRSLIDVEANRKYRIAQQAGKKTFHNPLEVGAEKFFTSTREKIVKVANNPTFRKNKSGLVRGVTALARTVAAEQTDIFIKSMSEMMNSQTKGRPGIAAGLVDEIKGPLEQFTELVRFKTNHDRERKSAITAVTQLVGSMFQGDLSRKAKDSLTTVVLRTGAHHLMGKLGVVGLERVLSDSNELYKEIADIEQQLAKYGKFTPYFVKQANVLGYALATGKTKGMLRMNNAHNIAHLIGTPYTDRISPAMAAEATPIVAELVSLYGLRYSKESQKKQVAEVLRRENNRKDNTNGVEVLMLSHKQHEKDALERLFGGNPVLMVHGYSPDIINPHIGVRVVPESSLQEMLDKGWKQEYSVPRDPSDPEPETKWFMTLRGGGLPPRASGAMNLGGARAKGSRMFEGTFNHTTEEGADNIGNLAAVTLGPDRQAALNELFKPGPALNLAVAKQTYATPLLNDKGRIVNWRYIMNDDSKDMALDRDNRFDRVMGVLAGSIYDKSTAREQNRKVLKAIKEQHKLDGRVDPRAYIEIGPDSTDPDVQEIWRMLPDKTREDIKAVWNAEPFMVRKDSLNLLFGYSKITAASIFEKDPELRKGFEKFFSEAIEYFMREYAVLAKGMNRADATKFAKTAALQVTKGERMWQDIVREAKDIIVVKTGLVLLGNIISNISLLWLDKVPFKEMLQSHMVALKGATTYMDDSTELDRLKQLLEMGYTQNDPDIEAKIARLEDALARNPVAELINAGLMPSIVEDVVMDEDPFSYRTALEDKVNNVTKNWNPAIMSAARTVYMAHDTKAYKVLHRTTQLSDFVARYTLYQHLTNRKENPLSKEEAIHNASEAFVNYDTPMHKAVQYSDDMGMTPFTKYFLRIQRVLNKRFKENPARVLQLLLLDNYVGLGPIVLESTALMNIGDNPLQPGPATFFKSLDDLATVSGAMALIK